MADAEALSVEDRAAIHDLVHRYGVYIDRCQMPEILGLFTDDSVLDSTAAGMGKAEGIDAIRALLEREFKLRVESVHQTTTHFADFVSTREASGTTYILVYANFQGEDSLGTIRTVVAYDDRYTKVDGKWLFSSRAITPVTAFDQGEIPGSALDKIHD